MGQQLEEIDEPLNILYYGEGGSAKTTNLCRMANLGKILVISAESGVKARALKACGVNIKNIEIYPGEGAEITYEGIEAEYHRIAEALQKKSGAYVGVVWDSLTEIYSVLLDQVVADAYKRSLRGQKPRESEFFIDRSDYGVMTEQVRKLIRKYRDLPCHFGACALERREVDENDGAVAYRPSVTPALQKDLYLWFDVVCHTTVEINPDTKEEQYRGSFRPIGKYRAKDRYKATPSELIEPTFDRVFGYVEGSLTLDNDPVIKKARAQKTTKGKPNA
jgi:hypothetical protein